MVALRQGFLPNQGAAHLGLAGEDALGKAVVFVHVAVEQLGQLGPTRRDLGAVGDHVLKPIGLAFELPAAAAALSISAFAIGSGSGRIVWGLIADRLGCRRTASLALVAIALSPFPLWLGSATQPGFLGVQPFHVTETWVEKLSALLNSPHLEKLKEKDFEVLLMTDPVDEWVVQSLNEYDGKPLKSAEKGDLDLDTVDDAKKEAYNALFGFIKGHLEASIKEVKPSSRLKDSVSCLSGDTWDTSAYMEKLLKASGQKPPESKVSANP